MKRLFIFSCFLLQSILWLSAQSTSVEERFSLEAEVGLGYLFGSSNLSPYGIDYRKTYNNGFSYNAKIGWMLDKTWIVGVKYNAFIASENYNREVEGKTADNLEVHYIAPQIGFRKKWHDKWQMEWVVGIGYLYYHNKSFCKNTEKIYTTGALGGNTDLTFSYQLYKNFYMGIGASLTGGHSSSLKEKSEEYNQTIHLNEWNRIKIQRADWFLCFKMVM